MATRSSVILRAVLAVLATLALTAGGCEDAPDDGPDPAPAESEVDG